MTDAHEEWRAIAGYEGSYAVSDLGHVKSFARTSGQGRPLAECVLRPSCCRGYLQVNLFRGGVRATFRVHHLVAMAFIGPRESDGINHIDGDKSNNRPCNLEYCTSGDNNRHALRTGLRVNVTGERHGRAKLTADDVREIRALVGSGELQYRVAEMFGVGKQAISKIVKRIKWQHV